MRALKSLLVTMMLGTVGFACASNTDETTDGTTDGTTASSSAALGEFCSTQPQLGGDVQSMAVADVIPQGKGGKIHSGTYVMVARTVYTGPGGFAGPLPGQVFNVTIVNEAAHGKHGKPSGNQVATLHAPVLPNGYHMAPGEQFHFTSWFATPGGAAFQSAHTCPDTMPVTFSQYTARGDDWSVFDYINNQEWKFRRLHDDDCDD